MNKFVAIHTIQARLNGKQMSYPPKTVFEMTDEEAANLIRRGAARYLNPEDAPKGVDLDVRHAPIMLGKYIPRKTDPVEPIQAPEPVPVPEAPATPDTPVETPHVNAGEVSDVAPKPKRTRKAKTDVAE